MFRAMYRGMGALSIRFAPSGRKLDYPWPYADPDFPGFPEDEDALVTDPAGFVIKRSTSYMAWCIYCYTGRWPRRRAYEGKRYDAKDWGEFLELNGFRSLKGERPWIDHAMPFLDAYIGINPKAGEFGQLYWLGGIDRAGNYAHYGSAGEHQPNELGYVCATYAGFKPLACWIAQDDPDVVWYGQCWDHF